MNHLFAWIDPVIFYLGPFAVRWYGLMYSLAFVIGYLWFHYSRLGKKLPLTSPQKDTLIFSIILGVLLGGRLGYILFYNLNFYLQNPLKIFAVWEGGMSFHGGVLGVLLALWWFHKKHKVPFLQLSDVITTVAPIGLFFGRIGNFINGELYGRIASNFCLYFPTDPKNCRYPTQLLESLFEGLVLFLILYVVGRKTEKPGIVSSFFLIFYGIFRFVIEFLREPDVQLGYLWWGFTQGQLLSVFMIIAGGILLFYLRERNQQKQ